jgi:hypothetical protein
MPLLGLKQSRAGVDRVLTHLSRGYRNDNRVGIHAFPVVEVQDYGGRIITFDSAEFNLYQDNRAPGGAFNTISDGYSGESYQLETRGLRYNLPREHLEAAERSLGIRLGTRAMQCLMSATTLKLEFDQSRIATNPANFHADHVEVLSSGVYWGNDGDNAVDPEESIHAIKSTVSSKIGVDPNVCILGRQVYDAMVSNPKIRDRIRYTSRDSITIEMLSEMYGIQFYRGDAIFKRSREGMAERVWGNYAFFTYVPDYALNVDRVPFTPSDRIDRFQPSGGFTYMKQDHPEITEALWDENTDTYFWKIRADRTPVISMRDANYLVVNPVKP